MNNNISKKVFAFAFASTLALQTHLVHGTRTTYNNQAETKIATAIISAALQIAPRLEKKIGGTFLEENRTITDIISLVVSEQLIGTIIKSYSESGIKITPEFATYVALRLTFYTYSKIKEVADTGTINFLNLQETAELDAFFKGFKNTIAKNVYSFLGYLNNTGSFK